MDYGVFGLIPVLCVLIIAITTRRTILGLACGTVVGAVMLGKAGFLAKWVELLYVAVANESTLYLGFMVIGFGIFIALLENSNAGMEFAAWARRIMKTKRQTLIGTFILSIVVFVDDYIHNLCVASTMRPITDSFNIPRTRLGYIVNVMAASIALLIPVASWAAVFSGLLGEQGVTIDGSASTAYLHAIPLIFYAWISVLVVFLSVIGVIPKMGLIKKDSIRAEETGNVFPAGYDIEYQEYLAEKEAMVNAGNISAKGNPLYLLIPLAAMLITAFVCAMDVVMAILVADIVAAILYVVTRKLKPSEMMQSCYEGCESMMGMVLIITLAMMLVNINTESGLVTFLTEVASSSLSPKVLPVFAFLLCGAYAYVSGSFWDMAMIILPIVVPVAFSIDADPILTSAAVFSGAAFGSNTCIYSDALIMCSQATKVKPADLMMAILPYAVISAVLSAILYLICGFIMC